MSGSSCCLMPGSCLIRIGSRFWKAGGLARRGKTHFSGLFRRWRSTTGLSCICSGRCNTSSCTAKRNDLSFRALDIEQIGHVYEGLLDHTAKRATEPMLSLTASKGDQPEVCLVELERLEITGETD